MSAHYSINLSVDQIMALSRERTGIDIVDSEVSESLAILHDSIQRDARLSRQGAEFLETEILRLLCNRLRMLRDFRAHPEILEQTIREPVFIMGLARTGSTKLQKLLARTGDFNWLPFWQGFNPSLLTGVRDESPQPRIDEADEFTRWYNRVAPDMAYMHSYETHEPEEEHLIHDHSFSAGTFSRYCNCSTWFQWLATQDAKDHFVYARDVLKYLQWQNFQDETKPWILKTPTNLGLEPQILDVFPDARFIVAHRHPEETTSSVISLIETWRKPFSEIDLGDIIKTVYEGASQTMQRHLINRRNLDISCLDLNYADIIKDSESVVKKIYDFIGMRFTEKNRRCIADEEANNTQNKHGIHKHSLENYNLTKENVREKYKEYIDFLDTKFSDAQAQAE